MSTGNLYDLYALVTIISYRLKNIGMISNLGWVIVLVVDTDNGHFSILFLGSGCSRALEVRITLFLAAPVHLVFVHSASCVLDIEEAGRADQEIPSPVARHKLKNEMFNTKLSQKSETIT